MNVLQIITHTGLNSPATVNKCTGLHVVGNCYMVGKLMVQWQSGGGGVTADNGHVRLTAL